MYKNLIIDDYESNLKYENKVSQKDSKRFNKIDKLELTEKVKGLKESEFVSLNKNEYKKNKIEENYKLDKLTNEELCTMYKNGDNNVLSVLVKKNERLVWSRVIKYRSSYKHKLDDEDLLQYGLMGFLTAIEKYDISREIKLSTYSIWWIDQQILRSIADYGFTVRVPVHIFDQVRKVTKLIRTSLDASEEELLELAENQGMKRDKFKNAMDILNNILLLSSINSIVGNDEEAELENFIEDKSIVAVEDEVEFSNLRECIRSVLNTLTPKEELVIKLRFGLEDGKQRTLEEIGHEINLTRERIRQIETKALSKLRQPSCAIKLRDFIF